MEGPPQFPLSHLSSCLSSSLTASKVGRVSLTANSHAGPSRAKVSTASEREKNLVGEHLKAHKLPFPNWEEAVGHFIILYLEEPMCTWCISWVWNLSLISLILHGLQIQQLPMYTFIPPCSSIKKALSTAMESDQIFFVFPFTSRERNHYIELKTLNHCNYRKKNLVHNIHFPYYLKRSKLHMPDGLAP